ncbi:uncharacterized protein LOC143469054 [Clavelina lepadiformis]|uniref:Uncharacterized protein n=1 Tax=Clavelina lepadiformis TaxID=159417 RepID=A0ABP0F4S5_CLALP
MKVLISFAILAIIVAAMAQDNSTCPKGRWGPDCQNVCGQCETPESGPVCNYNTGVCTVPGCLGEYSGDDCASPVCKGGCGSGECVAPGYCANCGDISKISPNCEDIRLRGLIGSLISFSVITVSITLCGFGSVWYKRSKSSGSL